MERDTFAIRSGPEAFLSSLISLLLEVQFQCGLDKILNIWSSTSYSLLSEKLVGGVTEEVDEGKNTFADNSPVPTNNFLERPENCRGRYEDSGSRSGRQDWLALESCMSLMVGFLKRKCLIFSFKLAPTPSQRLPNLTTLPLNILAHVYDITLH